MSTKHTPGPTLTEADIRAAYAKQYPESVGVAGQAARNHYAAFKTGWLSALAAIAKATGSAS
jgi:hypothetical protein